MRTFLPLFNGLPHPQIRRVMEQASACPECNALTSSLMAMSESKIMRPRFVIVCRRCGHTGPLAKSLPDAVRRWNKPLGFFAALLEKCLTK